MPSYVVTKTEYEGFPLAIRACPLDSSDPLWDSNPHLAFLEHELSHVRSNGLPESDYNDGLDDFDHEVHQAFERDSIGLVMIVETFGGKRCYYALTRSIEEAESALKGLVDRYSEHKLTFGTKPDRSQSFYRRYRDDFKW